jgi:general secretion pathway protein G
LRLACEARRRVLRNGASGFTIVELLVVLAIITVLAAIAMSVGLYAFDAARLGRSVADLRSISASIQQYKMDYATVPDGGLQPVANIAPSLGLVSRTVPTVDAWGNDLYYENLVVSGATTYRLFCYGKGGAPDGVITGKWIDFYSDTVVEGGVFIQSKY